VLAGEGCDFLLNRLDLACWHRWDGSGEGTRLLCGRGRTRNRWIRARGGSRGQPTGYPDADLGQHARGSNSTDERHQSTMTPGRPKGFGGSHHEMWVRPSPDCGPSMGRPLASACLSCFTASWLWRRRRPSAVPVTAPALRPERRTALPPQKLSVLSGPPDPQRMSSQPARN
jgi:hypothetical protein